MNKPYVKTYDENGHRNNHIGGPVHQGVYMSPGMNRRQRRTGLQKDRFHGNSKGVKLTVIKGHKFRRVVQVIKEFDGYVKRIQHYIPA